MLVYYPRIPGKLTIHPPVGPGEWQQVIGYAISPLELMFVPDKGWLNWAPIFEDIPTLYFTVGIESSASVELPLLLYQYNVIEGVDDGGFPTIETDYAYRFLLLPEWVTEHGRVLPMKSNWLTNVIRQQVFS